MRDSFIFYRSFYEAISDLEDMQQLEIYQSMANFSLNFEEPILSGVSATIFKLIKPQLEANNKRYLNGSKPKNKQDESKTEAKQKQKVSKLEANKNDNVNENDNVNKKENKDFSFTLPNVKTFDKLSQEYKTKLEDYINNSTGMSYEQFMNTCIMKDYKYKNFKMAYDKWGMNINQNYNRKRESGLI